MIKGLKDEMMSFIKTLETTIKDEKELQYIKEKTAHLFEVFADELEKVFKYKEDQIKQIEQRQQNADNRLEEMDAIIKTITKDLYDEYEDFEIICPYCNYEFDLEIDETISEIICPECENIIELDWETDVDKNFNCTGEFSGYNEYDNDNEK